MAILVFLERFGEGGGLGHPFASNVRLQIIGGFGSGGSTTERGFERSTTGTKPILLFVVS